jgi:catechol 2,3-dioxygenase-like lactoylglutathione lyase family enzyme
MTSDTPVPPIRGIHHLKFPVASLERAEEFYTRVFGAHRLVEFDHRSPAGTLFAVILEVPGLGTVLELRHNETQAVAQKGFDPVTLRVTTRAELSTWCEHLERQGVRHSPLLAGYVGWLVVFEDADERRIRLYSEELRGPEVPVACDSPWL